MKRFRPAMTIAGLRDGRLRRIVVWLKPPGVGNLPDGSPLQGCRFGQTLIVCRVVPGVRLRRRSAHPGRGYPSVSRPENMRLLYTGPG